MKKERFTEEQIVRIFRTAETTTIEAAARHHDVSEQSIYRWKSQFGQRDVDDVRELRHLRHENARLKKSPSRTGFRGGSDEGSADKKSGKPEVIPDFQTAG